MIDGEIRNAIHLGVTEMGQPRSLARRLEAWFRQLVEGTDSLDDMDSVYDHLELLLDAVEIAEVSEIEE